MLLRLVEPYLPILAKKYADDPVVPDEPDQTFLLGSRWADYGLALAFAIAFPILRAILKRAVFEPFGIRIIYGNVKKNDAKVDPERMRKWNESFWKLCCFSSFTTMALLVSHTEKWFWDTRYYWLGCSHFPPCNMIVSKGVLLFYCIETGFYLQSIHFLMFHEVRRKDWLESMIHHIVTAGLLCYSYYVNFTRIGIMVMLIHDVSDIFLELAKLCRYAKQQTGALVAFGVFFVTWILSRVMYFPLVIIRSGLTEPIHYARVHGVTNIEPHFTLFNGMLIILFLLHVYWTYLIFQVLLRQLFVGNTYDVREDDPDADDD
mmetsp:Transcript_10181/g.21773  ORF Transcript_10181/g.21773 Transcript_10181/m.21773 type:complete len:318 (-) Transcript_10181:652-1605(-)